MSDEKPSPGPWRWIKVDDDSRVLRHSGSDDPYYSAVFHLNIDGVGINIADTDAALIADAWQLPQLREDIEEMQQLLRELADSGLWLGGEEAGWTARIAALLDKHGRG
jgi:hypothetical protein